ncbi:CRISPR-associated protein Cmr2 [Lewinella aquimaris]|uniref:CRISPR-associated protein Cmr2 n=1 Tax=Neolewinella aquimaris TaxID=1835722 RepID=A0A840EHD5_9BACT|nr:type III-B CRISPR-associated protein Cas10/Cmr2 [Neolewinella aquimaris]MBB4080316.1 CRISPR-associated protein Cmr2 [Neolewinella aquimaris]
MTSEPTTYYLAVSIGPIYDTIQQARKTRELWTASYLFSFLMEQLVDLVHDPGANRTVLAPIPPDLKRFPELYGAGVYPDRLYAALVDTPTDFVEKTIATALRRVERQCRAYGTPDGYPNDEQAFQVEVQREKFWERYLRVAFFTVPASTAEAGGNLLKYLNDRLDTLELQPSYFASEPAANPLLHLLNHPYRSRLARQGLRASDTSAYARITDSVGKIERFPSTSEIATVELFRRDEQTYRMLQQTAVAGLNEQDYNETTSEDSSELKIDLRRDTDQAIQKFYELLFGTPNPLRKKAQPYHKYFCILHADGDSIGEAIKSLGNETQKITQFSERLADFAAAATQQINAYGGKPVYIGGDDLVLFAPVASYMPANESGEAAVKNTVFDLIAQLREIFGRTVTAHYPKTTISFGITLTYYKFPLFEARDESYRQLFYRAKLLKWQHSGKKNSVGFRLLKHSGSYFEGVMDNDLLEGLNSLVKELRKIGGTNRNEAVDFLSSFIFKLRDLEELVNISLAEQSAESLAFARGAADLEPQPAEGPPEPADSFFHLVENFFNEPVHKRYEAQRTAVSRFARLCFSSSGVIDDDYGQVEEISVTDNFYALLRLMDFMTTQKSSDDE